MTRWEKIVEAWEYATWDQVVECGTSTHPAADGSLISREEARLISSLGYYGKTVKEGDAQLLEAGKPRPEGLSVVYNGVDGNMEKDFPSLDAAKQYLKGRMQWCEGPNTTMTDYARYTTVGFTLADVGIEWEQHGP